MLLIQRRYIRRAALSALLAGSIIMLPPAAADTLRAIFLLLRYEHDASAR
jgi:hypothetical protein